MASSSSPFELRTVTYHGNLRSNFGNVGIGEDNRRVVAAHLQRHALDRLGRRRHDLLARRDRAREADLVDVRVVDEGWAEFVIAAQRLHETGREDLVGDLDHLQSRVAAKGFLAVSFLILSSKWRRQDQRRGKLTG